MEVGVRRDVLGRAGVWLHRIMLLWAFWIVNPATMNTQREDEGFMVWSAVMGTWIMAWCVNMREGEGWAFITRAALQLAIATGITAATDSPPDLFACLWTFWLVWGGAALAVHARPSLRWCIAGETTLFALWCAWWELLAPVEVRIWIREAFVALALPFVLQHPVHIHTIHGALLVAVVFASMAIIHSKNRMTKTHIV
jgi:hypothetical protein